MNSRVIWISIRNDDASTATGIIQKIACSVIHFFLISDEKGVIVVKPYYVDNSPREL